MLTVIIFIAVLGILVFVHELGHFLVAKKSHMQVDEFGFGFPPRVVGVYATKQGYKYTLGPKQPTDSEGTIYSINLIPLGGFVRIVGENNEDAENPRSFTKKSFFARLATLLAGVVMNAVLAWVLISIALAVGVPTAVDEGTSIPANATLTSPKVTIVEVGSKSPAQDAGIQFGDEIVSLGGTPVQSIEQVQEYVRTRKGEQIIFDLKRGDETRSVTVQSNANPPEGQGPTGIALGLVGRLQYAWYEAPFVGVKITAQQLYTVANGLWQLVSGGVSLDQLGGPVKIAQLTGQARELGLVYLLQFSAFLSLNLAVLNSLPIPALDGGRVLFLVIEKLRGKPNNQRIEQAVNAIGFVVLLLLMALVTVNDFNGFSAIGRLFGR